MNRVRGANTLRTYGRDIKRGGHGRIETRWISTFANSESPRKGANENDHELDAECKQNGQEMPEPKTTSRSENQHKNGRSRQVDKKGSATQ